MAGLVHSKEEWELIGASDAPLLVSQSAIILACLAGWVTSDALSRLVLRRDILREARVVRAVKDTSRRIVGRLNVQEMRCIRVARQTTSAVVSVSRVQASVARPQTVEHWPVN